MIKTILLALTIALSFTGCTDEVSTSVAPSQINTKADLDMYLANEPATSPLRAFAPVARDRFLAALTFSDKGGVSSYYLGEKDLSAEHARAVLHLFNVESDVSGIKPIEGLEGYRCVARATCQYIGAGYVCLATC